MAVQDTWRSGPSWCAGWESRRSTAGERSTLWQTCRQMPSLICGHPGRNGHFALRQCGPWTLWTLLSCSVQTHDTALTAPRKSDIWMKYKQIKVGRIYMLGVHSRTVLSLEDVATREPEGEKWTPVMASWWPTKRKALAFAARFQIIRVLSADPEAAGRQRKDEVRYWTFAGESFWNGQCFLEKYVQSMCQKSRLLWHKCSSAWR